MKLSQDAIQQIQNNLFPKIKVNEKSIENDRRFKLMQNDDETLSFIKNSYIMIDEQEMSALAKAISSLKELALLENAIVSGMITSEGINYKFEIKLSKQASEKILGVKLLKESLEEFTVAKKVVEEKESSLNHRLINEWATRQKQNVDGGDPDYLNFFKDCPFNQKEAQKKLLNQGYAWYKGKMTREAAEDLLRDGDIGNALIRIGSKGTLVLSKIAGNFIEHIALIYSNELDEVMGDIHNQWKRRKYSFK